MRFLVDNQLPVEVAQLLVELGHDATHVRERQLERADDRAIWRLACAEQRAVVSKDSDFVFLASLDTPTGLLVWIRLRNCRKPELLAAIRDVWPRVVEQLAAGTRVVEVH